VVIAFGLEVVWGDHGRAKKEKAGPLSGSGIRLECQNGKQTKDKFHMQESFEWGPPSQITCGPRHDIR
jgi:hypothetical protein